MNSSLLSDGEDRLYLIFYLGIPEIFCFDYAAQELGTGSPVAGSVGLVLPRQALGECSFSWLTALAWGSGLQGISLLSLYFSACVLKERRETLSHTVAHVR